MSTRRAARATGETAARAGRAMSLVVGMRDPNLLGAPFQSPIFWPWFCVAKLISGEPLDEREAQLFRECTGRAKLPKGPVKTLIFLSGRRSGKDRFMSAVAIYRAALAADWQNILALASKVLCF